MSKIRAGHATGRWHRGLEIPGTYADETRPQSAGRRDRRIEQGEVDDSWHDPSPSDTIIPQYVGIALCSSDSW